MVARLKSVAAMMSCVVLPAFLRVFPWEQAVPYETIKIQRNWTWDPPTPRSFTDDAELNMVKKFYIVSCAALVACLCLFPQDAGATARLSEAAARAPGASAGATIRPTQLVAWNKKKAKTRARRPRRPSGSPKSFRSGQGPVRCDCTNCSAPYCLEPNGPWTVSMPK